MSRHAPIGMDVDKPADVLIVEPMLRGRGTAERDAAG
jgi:hypothetical protein